MFYVNEYEVDRKYGGPEEGGWWYDTGKFIKCHGQFIKQIDAIECKADLAEYVIDKNEYTAPPSSVLSKGDWTDIYIQEY